MTDIALDLPLYTTPVIDARGYISEVWLRFFSTLLIRTGGTEGLDPTLVPLLLARINTLFGMEASCVNLPPPRTTMARADPPSEVFNHGKQSDELLHALVTQALAGFMSAADKVKLDGITAGAAVSAVTGTAPIASSGGNSPAISIAAATSSAAGSMSATDKTKLDGITSGAAVSSVGATAPITSSGGTAPTIGISPTPTFTSMSLTNGQIAFPATQVPSANANTLDDYAEGTWTPSITFATPGNLSVAYSSREGFYTKIGRMVTLTFRILTSTFTFTTASGALQITGYPFTSAINTQASGTLSFDGLTKPTYTQFVPIFGAGLPAINILGCGSGVGRLSADTTFFTSGTNLFLSGTLIYFV